MRKDIEFCFDFGSAPSFLAHTQLEGLTNRTGAEVVYQPVLVGAIFQATDNRPPGMVASKAAWFKKDMALFAAKYGVAFSFPDFAITNTILPLRGAYVARELGCFDDYCNVVFSALWVQGENIQDASVLEDVLNRNGLDGAVIIAGAARREIKEQLIKATEKAVIRGAFGTPTFFVGEQLFFGQDRLEFVEQAVTTQVQ